MDHDFFISIFQKKRSQQGKIWACVQADETSRLNNRHLHRSQTKETAPTHLVLSSGKRQGDGRDRAGLALLPQRPANVAWVGLAGKASSAKRNTRYCSWEMRSNLRRVHRDNSTGFNCEESSLG